MRNRRIYEPHDPHEPYGTDFVTNGFVVVAPVKPEAVAPYRGIDADPWPTERAPSLRRLLDRLGVPGPLDGVEAATNWDEAHEYWRRCRTLSVPAHLLLVATRYLTPRVAPPAGRWSFLGYDIAEPLGEHSLLRHEVIGNGMAALAHWRDTLNQAGLLPDLETAERFMAEWIETAVHVDIQGDHDGYYFVPVRLHEYEEEDGHGDSDPLTADEYGRTAPSPAPTRPARPDRR
jgi:hypothetical protein